MSNPYGRLDESHEITVDVPLSDGRPPQLAVSQNPTYEDEASPAVQRGDEHDFNPEEHLPHPEPPWDGGRGGIGGILQVVKEALWERFPVKSGIWDWGRTYDREANLMGDLISGLSIGIMLVPQGMAHAAIANMPPSTGLYAAFIPVIVYACIGSSRHLAPGSGALVALLIGSSLAKVPSPMADNGPGCSISLMDWGSPQGDTSHLHWESQSTLPCTRCVKTCFANPAARFLWEHTKDMASAQSAYTSMFPDNVSGQKGAWCVDRCLEDARTESGLVLSLISGFFLMLLGGLNFGYVVNFFSGPVLNGFTCAGGVIIALGQLSTYFGESKVEVGRACGAMFGEDSWSCETPRAYVGALAFFYAVPTCRAGQLFMSLFCTFLLIFFKKFKAHWGKNKEHPHAKKLKIIGDFGALWTVLLATILVAASGGHMDIVGSVPRGLPPAALPALSRGEFFSLCPDGFMIALLSFLASVAVASKFAKTFKYEIVPNQELFALGAGCFFGSFFGAFPIQGSLSRTAVNAQNAKTQVSSLITAVVVALSLVLITPLVYYLPKSALASIIILATQELLDFSPAVKLHKRGQHSELMVFCAAFVATLVLGVLGGLLSAMGFSVLMLTLRATKPPVRELAKVKGHRTYRSVELDYTEKNDQVIVIAIEGSLFFANAQFFRDQVAEIIDGRAEENVVFDFASVSDVDSTAVDVVAEIIAELSEDGKRVLFACLRQRARNAFYRSGVVEKVGQSNFFVDLHDAVVSATSRGKHRMVGAIRAEIGKRGGGSAANAMAHASGIELEWEETSTPRGGGPPPGAFK